MVVKENHTVVDKWSTNLPLDANQPGAKEHFDRLLPRSYLGTERYVEWKRKEPLVALSDETARMS